MGIISWIVLGLIAGVLARWIMPGRDPGGMIITILVGIAGAFVGGWLGSLTGLAAPVDTFSVSGIITATLGAIVLLALYRGLKNA